MTEITFRVPARLVHLMEELCKQFPDMEMVSKICPDSSREAIDGWATAAFGELQQNGTLRPGSSWRTGIGLQATTATRASTWPT